jgi:hypothetical protein
MIMKLFEILIIINLEVEERIKKVFSIFKIFFIFIWRSIVMIVKITHCQGTPSLLLLLLMH